MTAFYRPQVIRQTLKLTASNRRYVERDARYKDDRSIFRLLSMTAFYRPQVIRQTLTLTASDRWYGDRDARCKDDRSNMIGWRFAGTYALFCLPHLCQAFQVSQTLYIIAISNPLETNQFVPGRLAARTHSPLE